ncbi:phosphatidylinositol-3-phosphatase ymr1 [Savitreella phatthalungensis]
MADKDCAAKIGNVKLIRRGVTTIGNLVLSKHHLVFEPTNPPAAKLWICYPIVQTVIRLPRSVGDYSPLRIRCRDFNYYTFNFELDRDCKRVFEMMRRMTCVDKVERLFAYDYRSKVPVKHDGWSVYDPSTEFTRQGVGNKFPQWRLSELNADYKLSPTYPAVLAVPADVSDNVLYHAGKYRSKGRVPVLSYIHDRNGCSITRASQPLVGLKQNRSLQDEKLVRCIFDSNAADPLIKGSSSTGHLIVDARPTANAMANVAIGAGSENMDHYPKARKVYLGIDNIHVMRDSLAKVIESLKDGDLTNSPPNRELLVKSNWLKHISYVLDGAGLISRTVHLGNSNVLVHCSDGWDRTSQLCALAELCLDPYYRTLEGFIQLIEKDWLSFGHRFLERSGYLASEKCFVDQAAGQSEEEEVSGAAPSPPRESPTPTDGTPSMRTEFQAHISKVSGVWQAFGRRAGEVSRQVGNAASSNSTSHLRLTSPIFHQFLDCVHQVLWQHPTRFEFNDRFLRRLLYHTYSCQYGSFLANNERERLEAGLNTKTHSIWEYFLSNKQDWVNPDYVKEGTVPAGDTMDRRDAWLEVDVSKVRWWAALFNRSDEEMNGQPVPISAGATMERPTTPSPVSPSSSTFQQATPSLAASMLADGTSKLNINLEARSQTGDVTVTSPTSTPARRTLATQRYDSPTVRVPAPTYIPASEMEPVDSADLKPASITTTREAAGAGRPVPIVGVETAAGDEPGEAHPLASRMEQMQLSGWK